MPPGDGPIAMRSSAAGTTSSQCDRKSDPRSGPSDKRRPAIALRRQPGQRQQEACRSRSPGRARPAPSSRRARGSGMVSRLATIVVTKSGGITNSPVKARKSSLRPSGTPRRPKQAGAELHQAPHAPLGPAQPLPPERRAASPPPPPRPPPAARGRSRSPAATRRVDRSRSSVRAVGFQPPTALECVAPNEHAVAAQLGGAVGRATAALAGHVHQQLLVLGRGQPAVVAVVGAPLGLDGGRARIRLPGAHHASSRSPARRCASASSTPITSPRRPGRARS